MKILDVSKPLDRAAVTLKLSSDEVSSLYEALHEFLRDLDKHKVKAEYYGEAFTSMLGSLRDEFKHLIDTAFSQR
jgi:hypothetical protein